MAAAVAGVHPPPSPAALSSSSSAGTDARTTTREPASATTMGQSASPLPSTTTASVAASVGPLSSAHAASASSASASVSAAATSSISPDLAQTAVPGASAAESSMDVHGRIEAANVDANSVTLVNCFVRNGPLSLEWAVVNRQQQSHLQQTGRLPIVRLVVKESIPVQIELVFTVQSGPVPLVASAVYLKPPERHPPNSYVENLGVLRARAEPYRFMLRESMPPPSKLFGKQVYKLCITLTDPVHHATYFAYEIEVMVKKSLPTFLDPINNTPFVNMAAATTVTSNGPASPDIQASQPFWSHVQPQMIPQDEADTSTEIVTEEDVNSTNDEGGSSSKKGTGVLRELGYWLYSSNVGQYIMRIGDERGRDVKETYSTSTIWMLGTPYHFKAAEDGNSPDATTDATHLVPQRRLNLTKGAGSATSLDVNIGKKMASVASMAKSRFQISLTRPHSSHALPMPPTMSPPPTKRASDAFFGAAALFAVAMKRQNMVGELYSVRIVRRYAVSITEEHLGHLRDLLSTHNYLVKFFDDTAIQAEETDCQQPNLVHSVIVRVYYSNDSSFVDVLMYASPRKTSVMSSLLSVGTSSVNIATVDTDIIAGLVDKLFAHVDATNNVTGELVFQEGFNVDVTLSQQSAIALNGLTNESPSNARRQGPLSMWREEAPAGWTTVAAQLDDGVLSFSPESQLDAVPLALAALSLQCPDNTRRFDLYYNSHVYQFHAAVSDDDCDVWCKALSASVGLSVESFLLSRPYRLLSPPQDLSVTTDALPKPTSIAATPVQEDDPHEEHNQGVLVAFLQDFHSRFWFSYRKDFARLEPSFFVSDVGWGCMLRTAQMLVAHGIANVLLSRDWRLHQPQTHESLAAYKQILALFNDRVHAQSTFSLHHLVHVGLQMDKKVGEWFGPSTAAFALKRASKLHPTSPVAIYVNNEQTIFKDMVTSLACENDASTFKPVVILLPVRLGVEKLNEIYYEPLKALVSIPQSIGIAGGKPNRSHYFVACQDDELFYLDPHTVQPYSDVRGLRIFPEESCHCDVVRRIHISKLDPSMLVGFLVKSIAELDQLATNLEQLLPAQPPLLSVVDRAPAYVREMYSEVDASAASYDAGPMEWDVVTTINL